MSPHLNTLKEILKASDKKYLFPCIRDLVANGLIVSRFSSEEHRPSRQDITQYILAWFKYIGVSSDECRDWMIEYCVDVLSAISSSSTSQIRHSTKSNIRYIYNSDVSFDCGCENNLFKVSCDRNCPVYEEMSVKYKERVARDAEKSYEIRRDEAKYDEVIPQALSIKHQYRDQFGKALEFVYSQIKDGTSKQEIVRLLNDRGFKTRTGREWTYAILQAELRRHSNP